MKPSYLVGLLALAALAALVVQNPQPSLPLVFLGWRTPPYPLALWLVIALFVGLVVGLLVLALLPSPPRPGKYRPTAYERIRDPEPPEPSGPSEGRRYSGSPRPEPAYYASEPVIPEPVIPEPVAPEPLQEPGPAAADWESNPWQEWTQQRSPDRWQDWEQPEPAPSGPSAADGRPWWQRLASPPPRMQAEESWQELAEGWDGLEETDYSPAAGNPIQDTLDDINSGWEDPARSFERTQSPQQVRREGNRYSYTYHGEEDADAADDFGPGPEEVVDADYRVINAPYEPSDEDNDWVDDSPEERDQR